MVKLIVDIKVLYSHLNKIVHIWVSCLSFFFSPKLEYLSLQWNLETWREGLYGFSHCSYHLSKWTMSLLYGLALEGYYTPTLMHDIYHLYTTNIQESHSLNAWFLVAFLFSIQYKSVNRLVHSCYTKCSLSREVLKSQWGVCNECMIREHNLSVLSKMVTCSSYTVRCTRCP